MVEILLRHSGPILSHNIRKELGPDTLVTIYAVK